MLFVNGAVFLDRGFLPRDVRIQGDRIIEIGQGLRPLDGEEVLDIREKKLLPGLIDVHTHGRAGHDFSYADTAGIHKALDDYAANGVTSVLATTMTMEESFSKRMLERIAKAMAVSCQGARLLGINLEGPFLGRDKKGCHDERYLKPVSISMLADWDRCAKGNIVVVNLDPVDPQALNFIRAYQSTKILSIAHTSAGYDLACLAADAGAFHVTHLFNAMNPLHHREPGLFGMVNDKPVFAELITDGFHVHPSVVRMMFAMAPDKLCLVSDSLSAAGCAEGTYELGGLTVTVTDGKATLADGTLACSTISAYEGMRRCMAFGVPEEQAILAATRNPARSLRMQDQIGAIEEGLMADLLVTNCGYDLIAVYVGGRECKHSL